MRWRSDWTDNFAGMQLHEMRKGNMFRAFFLFLAALRLVAALPYNPSYIWTSTSQDDPIAYSLVPGSSKTNELQFRSIKLSESFDVASPPFSNLPAPLLSDGNDGGHLGAIIPASGGNGTPIIYTGSCQTDDANVWQFKLGDDSNNEHGTWSRSSVKGDEEGAELKGPNYLASAVTFPNSDRNSMPDIFVFGGMCPTAMGGSDTWVSAANYSDSVFSLRPDTSASDASYNHSEVSIRSRPVAEAGFTMTPLLPAYSNSSSGRQVQQQSFLLIGGHTQTAFINMSQVALFSLPEASWTYIFADDPMESNSEDDKGLEPRSGHTAVLTPDGSKIIVFGGWVGDISVPAQPQLAILNLGEEYGGSGDWTWSIPEPSSHGLREGTGVFGHGATMLPGGIMLVVGGYKIPERGSKRSSPQLSSSDQIYLLNTTSGTWVTSYTAPTELVTAGSSKGPLSSTSQKAGLGVGVGVGVPLAALAVFCIFYFFRNRQSREHKKSREQALRNLALGAERPHLDPPEMEGGFSYMREAGSRLLQQPAGGTMDGAARSYYENNDNWAEDTPSAAERTGLLVEVPSPTRGLRPNARAKSHQSAPFQDDSRKNIKFSPIHPIDEGEEYYGVGIPQPKAAAGQRESKCSGSSDPFKDPPSPSKTLFPSLIPQGHGDESHVQSWMNTVGESGTYPNPPHIASSDNQERTLSNLSGNSGSGQSTSSHRTNPMPLQRNPSQASRISAPTFDGALHNPRRRRNTDTDRNLYDGRPTVDRSQSQQSFSQLQAESGSLLGMPPVWMETRTDSPTKSSTSTRTKAMEWAGSVRRALSLLSRTEDAGRSKAEFADPIRETRRLQRSLSSSPAKSFYSAQEDRSQGSGSAGSVNLPRRAVSASSSALRLKQGAKDWNAKRSTAESSTLLRSRTYAGPSTYDQASSSGGRVSRSSGSLGNDDYDYDDDEDWDVEAAAEGRVVQVTYTVPKEKLRVVNAGAGDDSDDNDDDNHGGDGNGNDHDDEDNNGFSTPSDPHPDNGEGSSKYPPTR